MDSEKTRTTGITTQVPWKTLFGVSSILLALYGMVALLLTFGPILRVEASYQYRRALQLLGAESGLQLIVPRINFSTIGNSQHREYGIVIPELGLNEPVIFNTDATDQKAYDAALAKGIAHAAGTSIPDMGGIGYYFAHSSNPSFRKQYNAVFYLLGKLKGGEDIYIWHEGEKYQYRVSATQITTADDVSFLQNEYATESIVLQTCWPPGTTSKRLLVFGERVR